MSALKICNPFLKNFQLSKWLFLEILPVLSSNLFITCMHIRDMLQSGFLFDTILRFFKLIFKCLCLCFYCYAYKPSIYLLAFSFFVIMCFWYTFFTYFYIRPVLQEPLILFFIVANFSLMFYFIEIN